MLILAKAIAIQIILLEPPPVPANDWLVYFFQELVILILFIELPGSPGQERWFGNIRFYREGQVSHKALIVYRVRDHAVFTLGKKKGTENVLSHRSALYTS